jgi:hypothetical protein
MIKNYKKTNQSGFAAVTLIVFMVIAITITTAATTIIIGNNLAASQTARSLQSYYLAESGIEEGLINLLRNPNYVGTSGFINLGDGQVSIGVSSNTITSTAKVAGFQRTLKTLINNSGNLTISSWKETF